MSTPAQTTTTTTTTGTSQPTSDAEEDDAFTPTFYFYPWVGGVFSRGWAASKAKRLLETDDMLKLPLDETIGPTCADVIRLWEEEMERYTAELPTYKTPEEAAANEPALLKNISLHLVVLTLVVREQNTTIGEWLPCAM